MVWFFLSATAFLHIAWNGLYGCQCYCSHCKTAIWLKNAVAQCERGFTIRVFRKYTILTLMRTLYSHTFSISSLFAPYNSSKCEIRYQWDTSDCIWFLHTSLLLFISNGTTKIKLATLAFLYCGESVKNSICMVQIVLSDRQIFLPTP